MASMNTDRDPFIDIDAMEMSLQEKEDMANRKYRYFSCDFETTVYEGQTSTEVWASAVVELGTEDVKIFHSIDETFDYFKSLKCNMVCYYHNLKFDGNFWLYYLINVRHMEQAVIRSKDGNIVGWKEPKDMYANTFSYAISDRGQWYMITIKLGQYVVELRDSLKLLPFSVKQIGKAFKTKHQKLDMEYKGFRYAGCNITDEEKQYIANDVLVVKEALEIMFNDGHKALTIGACCMKEYKGELGNDLYNAMFPDLTEMPLEDRYGASTADAYIRHSYRGGWCYLAKGKENRLYHNGSTADVNSLYPSMMSSESGNYYPVGYPTFWSGDYIPDKALQNNRFYFIRFTCSFNIKKNMLPFVQIKGSYFYAGTEMLETSDLINKTTGERTHYYIDSETGEPKPIVVTLTMTMTDWKLFNEHYYISNLTILDGCYFNTEIGIFDEYINKYKKIKLESKGAMRTEAKLFLNNLYGKMASSTDSSFKVAFMKPDESVGFEYVEQHEKTAGYIAVGSAITSYARNFTIRAAQKNYHGVDKQGFIYADTDSIHCDLPTNQFNGITVHDKNFCCWKLESTWDIATFTRQKTYIEHVVAEDCKPIDNPWWNVKCAGMPDRCKQLFVRSMEGDTWKEGENDEVKEFLSKKRTLEDFRVGLKIPGKLMPKRIKGGVVLVETTYEMR